jgi:sterol desaturase/sphingolipid hydroxylase (fatty acid hydroxylase superfamily)
MARDLAAILFSPSSRFWIAYLLFAYAVALGVYYWRSSSVRAAYRFVFRRDIFLHRSAINDYILGAFNLIALTFLSNVVGIVAFSAATKQLLHAIFGSSPGWHVGASESILYSLAVFIAYDGANFCQHWIQHKVPLLWELHKVHHSAEVMTPITAVRVHPLSELFAALLVGLVVGTVNGTFLYLYSGHAALYAIFGTNIFFFLYYSVGLSHLQHSHVWLTFPLLFRGIFVSPAMHMIHHSRDPRHYNKNLGFMLAIWDRMAGTLHVPDDNEQEGLQIGIAEAEQDEMNTVYQLCTTPLKRIASIIRAS